MTPFEFTTPEIIALFTNAVVALSVVLTGFYALFRAGRFVERITTRMDALGQDLQHGFERHAARDAELGKTIQAVSERMDTHISEEMSSLRERVSRIEEREKVRAP